MPYADPDRRREYMRSYRRLRRAGDALSTPAMQPVIPSAVRIQTAADVLQLLEGQAAAVQADPAVRTVEKARAIGYLAAVALRALEARDTITRIEALEAVLKRRNGEAGR
jgi:hypothetical protein